ncbi:MAG: PEGA domain-containing protein [Spirochaetales bacterium]|nr:PEGA domain-containing protein [Spirochaetales bacterium]
MSMFQYVWKRVVLLILVLLVVSAVGSWAQGFGSTGPSGRYSLTVTADVSNAVLFINNRPSGNTPVTVTLPAGNYEIRVAVRGYPDYRRTIKLTRNMTINVAFANPLYTLTVSSNIQGAEVYLNGEFVGNTPLQHELRQGNYHLRVAVTGYREYTTDLTISRNTSINVPLEAATALVSIYIPEQLLNRQIFNAESLINIYVDGELMNVWNFQLRPGRHIIRVVSGGFAVEQAYVFRPGVVYQIQPQFGMLIVE